jgi:2-polyprenyl-3-methyl-5-hydroxy-6-metoxy-1,4-benzoquinol methylase
MPRTRDEIPTPHTATADRTIESYEAYAATYDRLVGPTVSADIEAALRRLVAVVRPGGEILEIGSGPGREADTVEQLGVRVRRTDATRAFIALQARRGKHAELLNVITDELGGPYDGVLAMCVLIHVGFDQTDAVLGKIAAALRPGGGFLVSMREGDGETHGKYHTVYWRTADFTARLKSAGLRVDWEAHSIDSDGDAWLTYLATKPGS